jgi:hypothetical protein
MSFSRSPKITATVPVSKRLPKRWPGRNAVEAVATRAPLTMSSEFCSSRSTMLRALGAS